MLTFRKARGVAGSSERVAIMAPSPDGGYEAAAGQFDGTEPLACVVWPGDDRAQVATLPVAWVADSGDDGDAFDPANPRVDLDFPLDVMEALDVGRYQGRVQLDDLAAELVRFVLEVEGGPGTAAARAVYHSYRDLKDEYPDVERLAYDSEDQTGFNEAAASARDWIDAAILAAVPKRRDRGLRSYEWGWSWGDSSDLGRRYSEALAGDALLLDTPQGRRIRRASVYKTLAVLCRRAVGITSAPDNVVALGARYERLANDELICCTGLTFDPSAGRLPPLSLGVARRAR